MASATTEFWTLMERRGVPDEQALALVEFGGKIGKSGIRPRFKLITKQMRLLGYLQEIDTALGTAGHDLGWLRRSIRAAPFRAARR
jgi:hypothetical protein